LQVITRVKVVVTPNICYERVYYLFALPKQSLAFVSAAT